MRIRPSDCTDDFRTVMYHATAHARRLGHPQKDGEHLLLALAALDTPAGAVLREHGITPERVEEEIVRREGLGAGAALFAGLDPDALAAAGVDLGAVRASIEASFGPEALAQAGQAARRNPRRPSGLNPDHPRPMPPGPIDRWRHRRRTRYAIPAPPVLPAPPGLYQFTGTRLDEPVRPAPGAKRTLERTIREAQIRHDPQLGAEHIALAVIFVGSGLVPAILSAVGVSGSALRAAILDHHRQAS